MSARILVAYLPARVDQAIAWSLVTEDGIVDGDDLATAPLPADDLTTHAIAAPQTVSVHRVSLPALAPNQARAAALLLAAEASAAPPEALHVAIGAAEEDGARLLAVVDPVLVDGWLAGLAAHGHAPSTLHPAQLLLPPAAPGEATLGQVGPFAILRTADGGFADDDLRPLLTTGLAVGDAGPLILSDAIEACPVDLLQGRFATRIRRTDWHALRRMARLAAVALAMVLATQLVLIGRYQLAADAAERRTAAVVAGVSSAGDRNRNGAAALAARLATLEGPGGGFAAVAGPVLDALAAAPGVDLTELAFAPDGALAIQLSGPDAAMLSAVANAIQARGVRVELGESGAVEGRTRARFTVRAS